MSGSDDNSNMNTPGDVTNDSTDNGDANIGDNTGHRSPPSIPSQEDTHSRSHSEDDTTDAMRNLTVEEGRQILNRARDSLRQFTQATGITPDPITSITLPPATLSVGSGASAITTTVPSNTNTTPSSAFMPNRQNHWPPMRPILLRDNTPEQLRISNRPQPGFFSQLVADRRRERAQDEAALNALLSEINNVLTNEHRHFSPDYLADLLTRIADQDEEDSVKANMLAIAFTMIEGKMNTLHNSVGASSNFKPRKSQEYDFGSSRQKSKDKPRNPELIPTWNRDDEWDVEDALRQRSKSAEPIPPNIPSTSYVPTLRNNSSSVKSKTVKELEDRMQEYVSQIAFREQTMRLPNATQSMKELCAADIRRYKSKIEDLSTQLQEINVVMDDRYLDLPCPPDRPDSGQDTSKLMKLALKFTNPERVIRTVISNAIVLQLSHKEIKNVLSHCLPDPAWDTFTTNRAMPLKSLLHLLADTYFERDTQFAKTTKIQSFAFKQGETIRQGLARLDTLISQTEAFYPLDQRVGRRANLKYNILMAVLPPEVKKELRLNEYRAAKSGTYYETSTMLIDAEDIMAASNKDCVPIHYNPIMLANAVEVNASVATKRPRYDDGTQSKRNPDAMDFQSKGSLDQGNRLKAKAVKRNINQPKPKGAKANKNYQEHLKRIKQQQQEQQDKQQREQQYFDMQKSNWKSFNQQYGQQTAGRRPMQYNKARNNKKYNNNNNNKRNNNNNYNYSNNKGYYSKQTYGGSNSGMANMPVKTVTGYDPRNNKTVVWQSYEKPTGSYGYNYPRSYTYQRVNAATVATPAEAMYAPIEQEPPQQLVLQQQPLEQPPQHTNQPQLLN